MNVQLFYIKNNSSKVPELVWTCLGGIHLTSPHARPTKSHPWDEYWTACRPLYSTPLTAHPPGAPLLPEAAPQFLVLGVHLVCSPLLQSHLHFQALEKNTNHGNQTICWSLTFRIEFNCHYYYSFTCTHPLLTHPNHFSLPSLEHSFCCSTLLRSCCRKTSMAKVKWSSLLLSQWTENGPPGSSSSTGFREEMEGNRGMSVKHTRSYKLLNI